MADDFGASTATIGRVTVGGTTNGQLETAGDRDWFAVNLVAGKIYNFTVTGITLGDPNLKLYGTDGVTVLKENNDPSDVDPLLNGGLDAQIVNFSISASGTYYLEASDGSNGDLPGSQTGSYQVAASLSTVEDDYLQTVSTTGRITSGGSATGQLEFGGDYDWFAVTLVAGKKYTFTLESGATSGLSNPFLGLYNSAGTRIDYNDDGGNEGDGTNSRITYTATTSGTYFLSASDSTDSEKGSYVLRASLPITDDYSATISTSGQVTAGSSSSGQLENTGDSDWFAINLLAGQAYTFSASKGTTDGLPDPFLTLYGIDGTLITTDDDTGGDNSAEISYTAVGTGKFYLGVTSSPHPSGQVTGSYTVSASLPTATGDQVLTGTTSADTLTSGVGNDVIDGGSGVDTVEYSGARSSYTVTSTASGYTVADKRGTDGTDTVTNVETLKFTDMSVNLTVQANAASISTANLNSITELYVAYFNRVPDADGLNFWINEFKGGMSLNKMGDSFYANAISPDYTTLTGYASTMTDAEFIIKIYQNVLRRTVTADDSGVTYWRDGLADHSQTRGSLVNTMIVAAHGYKGSAEFGWVADLLDNKLSVGKTFAVDQGLNYNSSADSITHGMEIAAAVTQTSTAAAIALIGISDAAL